MGYLFSHVGTEEKSRTLLERSLDFLQEHAHVVCRNLTVFDGRYGVHVGLVQTTVKKRNL